MSKKNVGGRPRHPLGLGVQTSVMIPKQLHAALRKDVRDAGFNTISEAIIHRLKRGKPRGRDL